MVKEQDGMQDLYALKLRAIIDAFKKEPWSFRLIFISLFFDYVRPHAIYPALDILPWTQMLLLTTLAIVIFRPEKKSSKKYKHSFKSEYYLTPLFFLFVFHCLVSGIFAYSQDTAFANKEIMLAWLIFYFLIASIVNTERRFYLFLLLFLLANFKMSQHGFKVWAGRGFSFASWGVSGTPGYFANSGEFGMQMCIFFPLVTATLYAIRPYITKIVFRVLLLMPITAVGSVIASSSRGDLLALFVMITVYILRGEAFLRNILLGGCILVVIYFIVPDEFINRFETAGEDTTSVSRLEYWGNGKKMADKYPILGVGYHNWEKYYSDFYFDRELYHRVETAHNTFVQAMAELGYAGLVIFLSMCLASFRLNLATQKIGKKCNNNLFIYLPLGFNIALLGLIVSSSFIAALYYPFYWIHFAFTVSLNKAAKNSAMERELGIKEV